MKSSLIGTVCALLLSMIQTQKATYLRMFPVTHEHKSDSHLILSTTDRDIFFLFFFLVALELNAAKSQYVEPVYKIKRTIFLLYKFASEIVP